MLQKTLAQSRAYDPELSGVYNKLLQEVFFRLDGSMQGFFRRVQAGEKPGRGFFSFLTCGQSPNAGLSNSSQGGEKVERRKDTGAPVVALVGYTNAGKSTLLNRLASANGLAEDRLFATLDPMTRRVRLAGGQEFLLTDTVGFVHRLPTTLVAAFRATLEEVAEADLLVHVVDASSPSMHVQIEAVEQVLEEIGAGGRPTVLALNKIDVLPCDVTLQLEGMAATLPLARVSALQGDGIDDLLHCISENLLMQFTALDVLIPYDRGELVALFHKYGTIENESYEESGTRLRGYMPGNHSGLFTSLQNVLPQSAQVRHTTRKIK